MDWREVWRWGIAPQLSEEGLEGLRRALAEDDPALVHGLTVLPEAWSPRVLCEGGCAIGYALWKGGRVQASEVLHGFFGVCNGCQRRLGDTTHMIFLRWFDEAPRDQVRRELLAEVDQELALRAGGECG